MGKDAVECYLASLEKHAEPFPADVETVSFEWGDANEAMVYRLAVREAAHVA